MRILVADDHPLIRRGLRVLLEESIPGVLVDEAADGGEVLDRVRASRYAVVVLDLSMPGRDGLDVLRDLKAADPEAKIVILSIQSEDQYAVRAFRLGASSCLNKSSAPEELVAAVKAVLGGHRYLSPKAQELLIEGLSSPAEERLPHERLSDREFQVFRLLASGKTVGEVAELMSLSVKTVSTYRMRIIEKTGLENNARMMRYAVDHGIAD